MIKAVNSNLLLKTEQTDLVANTKLASHCLTNAAFVVWHSTVGVGTIGFWVSRLQNVPKVRGNVR